MPDSDNNGYLEHFLAKLAPQADELWKHTESTLEQLGKMAFPNKFSPVRLQKALVNTWLAWQKEPGKRFGDAVKAGYFDAKSPAADAFVDWMTNTFELEN